MNTLMSAFRYDVKIGRIIALSYIQVKTRDLQKMTREVATLTVQTCYLLIIIC